MRFAFAVGWVLVLCVCARASEGAQPCSVFFVGSELKLDPPAKRLGDECFVPVRHLPIFGWDSRAVGDRALVRAPGREASIFLREVDGEKCFPLRSAAQLLGGMSYWREDSRLDVKARLEWVGAGDGSLSVKTSFPVKAHVFAVDEPNRLVMDLPGTVFLPGVPPVMKGVALGVRMSEWSGDVLRIVCDLSAKPQVQPIHLRLGRQYEVRWNGARLAKRATTGYVAGQAPGPATTVLPKGPRIKPGDTKPTETKPADTKPAQPTGPLALGEPAVSKVNDNTYVLRIPTDRVARGKTVVKRNSSGITIELMNATAADKKQTLDDAGFLKGVALASRVVGSSSAVVLDLSLKGACGVNLAPSAKELVITLVKPKSASGKLTDKTVVVDPGHGGDDSGACDGGIKEKEYNLAIGSKLAEELSCVGATAVETRSDDSYPTLYERADIANAAKANFLISIHHNSNSVADSRSGTFTYYHEGSTEGKLLAECIQRAIAAVSGLPDNGVAVDTSRFKNGGMVVLRRAKMPAVLIEVAYMNNAKDREKITSEDFQKTVAKAIAKGIRDYLGDEEETR